MAHYLKDWDGDDYGQDEEGYDSVHSLESSDEVQEEFEDIKHEDGQSHSSQEGQESLGEVMEKSSQQYIEIVEDENPFPLANSVRITNPYMSKYERAAILGKRAEQIASGSPIYISLDLETQNPPSPLEVAEQELKEGKIPFIVRRNLPNAQFEDWKIEELKL